MVKLREAKISPKVNPLKVVAAVLTPITERMEIIKATNEEKKSWHDQTVNLWIEVEAEALSEISE